MHGDLLTRKCSFLKWWLAQGRKALSLESKAFSFWLENPKLKIVPVHLEGERVEHVCADLSRKALLPCAETGRGPILAALGARGWGGWEKHLLAGAPVPVVELHSCDWTGEPGFISFRDGVWKKWSATEI